MKKKYWMDWQYYEKNIFIFGGGNLKKYNKKLNWLNKKKYKIFFNMIKKMIKFFIWKIWKKFNLK